MFKQLDLGLVEVCETKNEEKIVDIICGFFLYFIWVCYIITNNFWYKYQLLNEWDGVQ
jgi:hypothetical protein